MNIFKILYICLIRPLELLFEVFFCACSQRIPGEYSIPFTIVILSLIVNALALPLYKRADKLQSAESARQAAMKPWIDHIKKSFTGDERFLMLQTYYRENNYKPIYVLKGSLSLLLQIPFFIAAYNFLSELPLLNGVSLGPIHDLGASDAMFYLGSFPVNLLPIMMTLINVISVAVYTKGKPLSSKLQSYGIAVVFLVLLYKSPAGLVFYWLMNQMFSLAKNVVMVFFPVSETDITEDIDEGVASPSSVSFWVGCVFLTLLTGLMIPSNVISSSVAEFIDYSGFGNPLYYIIYTILLAMGTFIIWFGIYYGISNTRERLILSRIVIILCSISVIDYFFFGKNLGFVSAVLQYDEAPHFGVFQIVVNIVVVLAVSVLLVIIHMKKNVFISGVLITGAIAMFCLGSINAYKINSEYSSFSDTEEMNKSNEQVALTFSQDGKNVVFLLLDRAMETMVPYIMNEKSELKEQFDGFTFYGNTVSLGGYTNFGAPAAFGGYDYSPENMNKRDGELLVDKHNEALKVLPVMFSNEGYDVMVSDLPYVNYTETSDLSIYDGYDNIKACVMTGKYGEAPDEIKKYESKMRERNFFMFSIAKICPLFLHNVLYDSGLYNSPRNGGDSESQADMVQERFDLSHSHGYNQYFVERYNVLKALPEITEVDEDDGSTNRFFMLYNSSTHEPCMLQEPEYEPALDVDNSVYDHNMIERYTLNGVTMPMESDIQVIHYHANIAALSRLGDWFDYLRDVGVYDNTRIIIVADHGRPLNQFGPYLEDGTDCEYFYPLFMFKDFDSTGFTVSDEFMTNADAACLTVNGVIKDPVNPFTGNRIDSHEKVEGAVNIIVSDEWDVSKNNGTKFLPANWYNVHDDVYNTDDWTYLGNW